MHTLTAGYHRVLPQMSRMTMAWSLCRALFGSVAVASVANHFLTTANSASGASGGYSMALVTVFLVSEVAPFLLALSSDLLTLLAWDNRFFGIRHDVSAPSQRRRAVPGPLLTAAQL